MKVILLDDEKAMTLVMKKMLNEIPAVEVLECFQDSAEAFKFLQQHEVDVVFVDIEMPVENGVEFAKRVWQQRLPVKIVFLTSHKEYALEAFDVDAADYLVKPVSEERLERTINKVLKNSKGLNQNKAYNKQPLLSFYGLGSEELRDYKGKPVKWISAKSRELLSYFVFHNGRQVSRAMILEDVFAGMEIKNSEVYLNTAVYQMRKSLECVDAKSIVVTNGDKYVLDLEGVYVDFIEFESKIKSFWENNSCDLKKAMEIEAIYQGDLFGDKLYQWAIIKKEQLFEDYSNFVKRLAIELLTVNETGKAYNIISKLLTRNCLDEEANRIMLRIYHRKRDSKSLNVHYKKFEQLLKDELGILPDSITTNLFEELKSL